MNENVFQVLPSRGRNRFTGMPSSLILSNNNTVPISSISMASTPREALRKLTAGNSNPPIEPKSLWGQPTWFLLHTLAEKVDEKQFHVIKRELLQLMYSICINLPCPTCATHAKEYLDGINFNTIQSKEQLKEMMFNFHNVVNKKKGYTLFRYDELNDKYTKAVTVNIIRNFMTQFDKRNKSIRLIADDLHRQKIASKLRVWFNNNILYFSS